MDQPPRHPTPAPGRRTFLKGSLGAAALLGGLPLLDACSSNNGSAPNASQASLILARPDHPVTLPIPSDNQPIADNLPPEKGGKLQILNYADYTSPTIMKDFGDQYSVECQVTVFNNYDEMVAKLTQPGAQFDVVFPGPTVIGKLALTKLIQPLNHSYLTNFSNVWPMFQNPFYDQQDRYSVPYTVYTTGIAYRTDRVKSIPDNGWDLLWDSTYKGQVSILNDDRESLGMAMLRAGETDVNTEDQTLIDKAGASLTTLIPAVNVKVTVSQYTQIPEGQTSVALAWSGDMVAAPQYLPKGTPPTVLGYWIPKQNVPTGNDNVCIPKSSQKPVLAHLFMDQLLSSQGGELTFKEIGYQPALNSIQPAKAVSEGLVPANLANTVLTPDAVKNNVQYLALTPAGEKLYQDAWATFQAGA
jgi:spermidine/putrescine transport system substrate-binding protein